jgi:maltooligosyltrehalose synthase
MYSQDEKQLQKDKLQGEMRLPQKLLTSSLEEAPNSTIQTSKLAQELVDLVSHLPEFRYTYRNTRK